MRIVVNDIAANVGGAMTVLQDFYECVCEYGKEHEWIFLLGDHYLEERDNIRIITLKSIKSNPLKKVLFDVCSGKKFIENLKPDAVLSLQNIITFGVSVPQVVYVHQPIPFQKMKSFSFFKSDERALAFKQFIVGAFIKASVKRADSAIVQTDWMKQAVCRDCAVSENKVMKCTPDCRRTELPCEAPRFESSRFFYPTSDVLYKNNRLVFAASKALEMKGVPHAVEMTLNPQNSSGSVNCIGRIPFDSVIEKYRASTLLFPSYIETFGYPLVEARRMGTVILAADTPFAKELLAGYENAYYFEYDSSQQLADLMRKVISGEIIRTETKQTDDAGAGGNCWLPVVNCMIAAAENRNHSFTVLHADENIGSLR